MVNVVVGLTGPIRGMTYSSDLTDEQWALLEHVFNAPGKSGPKHAPDLRRVVDAMLYISHTRCQWRFLPESFGGHGREPGRSSAVGRATAPGH